MWGSKEQHSEGLALAGEEERARRMEAKMQKFHGNDGMRPGASTYF